MRKWVPWLISAIVLVAAIAVAAPWLYAKFVAEDDAPAASVSTEGARPASGAVDGDWVVAAGSDPNTTAAGYTVHEILNGESVTVVGSTHDVSGTATIENGALTAAEVTVQVATIATDSGRRDSQFRGNVMQTDTFPTATFTLDGPVDLSGVPDDGTVGTVTAPGTLALKDRTQHVDAQITVLRSGDELIASGSVPTVWTDYGVQPPSLGFVTVDGNGSIDFLVTFARG
ncbi:YceI family protein [Rhodococcus sp. HNM0569]|uniref:YceI family protein n=1 Tax=Rhodococcus sp. HNM0569 TaxID=2716340 RepID=UPI00146DB238|nr:YceI family protein [Rhodococcus sp. HNM0569]NLU82441.1 YceI family protein [Rhodococcus sp. HNM0569]